MNLNVNNARMLVPAAGSEQFSSTQSIKGRDKIANTRAICEEEIWGRHNGMAENNALNMSIPAFDDKNQSQQSGEIGFKNSKEYCYQPPEQIKCQTNIWSPHRSVGYSDFNRQEFLWGKNPTSEVFRFSEADLTRKSKTF